MIPELAATRAVQRAPETEAVECRVVDWRRFTPSDFEYDFERDKLLEHRVSLSEAVEYSSRISKFDETKSTLIVTS